MLYSSVDNGGAGNTLLNSVQRTLDFGQHPCVYSFIGNKRINLLNAKAGQHISLLILNAGYIGK